MSAHSEVQRGHGQTATPYRTVLPIDELRGEDGGGGEGCGPAGQKPSCVMNLHGTLLLKQVSCMRGARRAMFTLLACSFPSRPMARLQSELAAVASAVLMARQEMGQLWLLLAAGHQSTGRHAQW